jgi:hypothetical protein
MENKNFIFSETIINNNDLNIEFKLNNDKLRLDIKCFLFKYAVVYYSRELNIDENFILFNKNEFIFFLNGITNIININNYGKSQFNNDLQSEIKLFLRKYKLLKIKSKLN